MSSVVFIMGAGASQQCGGPLMGNFLDVATDLLRSNSVGDKTPQFEKVFSTIGGLQIVHSKAQLDLTNIESIFTVLELGKVIKRVPGLKPKEIPQAIAALKDLIVKTLEKTILFPTLRNNIYAPQPYAQFADLLVHLRTVAFPKHTVSTITFNYDLAVDMALYRAGLGPDYIISKPSSSSCIDPVPLMKLHGSLNWATRKKTILPLHLHDYLQKYSFKNSGADSAISVEIGSKLREVFQQVHNVEVNPEPVIVPPSLNKADYHHALSDIWASAARHLSEAEYIFVLGYSLPETDSFFKHLYALGSVGVSPLRKMMIYDPDPTGAVDGRFKKLLGTGAASRYVFKQMNFEMAVNAIAYDFPSR